MSRHDKDYNSSVKLSAYADLMLDRIDTCISDKISKSVTRLASAIVTKVNSDGSVNIRLPSEDNSEFTKIQNQCPYELKVGDAVELTLKNGSFNNCWVSARHGMGTRITNESSSELLVKTYVSKDGGILSNVNADILTTTGTYVIGKGCTNFPSGSEDSVVQVVGAGGKAYQTTVIYSTNIFVHRAFNGISWTSWHDENGAVISSL